jgi:hypothetical protein
MGAEMRAMLTGGGVVLVVVGGLFGLWSMGQAPASARGDGGTRRRDGGSQGAVGHHA